MVIFKYRKSMYFISTIILILAILTIYIESVFWGKLVMIFCILAELVALILLPRAYWKVEKNCIIIREIKLTKCLLWEDINQIILSPESIGILKNILIISNKFSEPIVISSFIKDYKKLIQIIIEKCKDNNEIFIDEEVLKIIS